MCHRRTPPRSIKNLACMVRSRAQFMMTMKADLVHVPNSPVFRVLIIYSRKLSEKVLSRRNRRAGVRLWLYNLIRNQILGICLFSSIDHVLWIG